MPVSFAILLDGGFIRRKLGTSKLPVDAAGISAFTTRVSALPCVADLRLHRIYFYDARPLEGVAAIPLGGGQMDFGAHPVATRNRTLQSHLVHEPFFALRFGDLVLEGWRLKRKILNQSGPTVEIDSAAIEPNIRQKGVDMRIGLDIADSDFIPAMKFARREGAQLFLITLGHGIKDGMREHADLVIDSVP